MSATAVTPEIHSTTQKVPTRNSTHYLIFTLCASIYLLPFMRILMQGTDEGTLLYGAVRVVHGQVLARDFFDVMGPGTFYWLAAFFKLFGVTFMATRICLFVMSLGTGLLIYFLSRRICRRYSVLPCLLLAGTYFSTIWPEINHHVCSNFFALLSVACIVLWQDKHRNGLLFAAGVLAGVTTCFLQPKGMLLLFAILLWLWMQRKQLSTTRSSLGTVIGGYCVVVGIVLIYFWSRGALRDLIYVNLVWPSRHYDAINAVPYALGILHYWNQWVRPMNGVMWFVVMASVLIIPFLLVAALPALLLTLGIRHRTACAKPTVLLYWLCGWALWLSEIHRKDICHLVSGSPLLIILCIYLLAESRGKVAALTLQILSVSAACLAVVNLFVVLTAHTVNTRVGSAAVFQDDPVLTFLDEHVAPGEEIFAYPYCPMYYFLSSTTNPTRYSLLIYNYNTSAQFHEVIQVLEQHKVRYVLWDTNFQTKKVAALFPASVRIQPRDLIMEPYLDSHYKLVKVEDGVRIMERKSEDHSN